MSTRDTAALSAARSAEKAKPGTARTVDTARVGRRRPDAATIFGLLGAITLIAGAIVLGGSWTAFVDGPAILIVIGGTLAITAISLPASDALAIGRVIGKAVSRPASEPREAAAYALKLAEAARKHGVLEIPKHLGTGARMPFLEKAMGLVADGLPAEEVERILGGEIAAMGARHQNGVMLLRRAAEVAPAMGLIGTLIGLVQMLGELEDPSTVGPSMAVALLTTFYGALLANLIFAPLAAKLERNSEDEVLLNQVYLLGAVSISRLENPRRLEMHLNALLPPAQRIRYFD